MIYTKAQTKGIHQQTFAYLNVIEQNHVLNITLNRPKQKNALNEVLTRELAYAISYAQHDNNIWVVTLGAEGNIFCAGADLKTFMGHKDVDSGSTIPDTGQEIILGDLFDNLHKPCIAKVGHPVYAGGFLLLAGCTHVVATTSSTFTLSEVKRGIWPFQVMASLLKIMPERKVLDWCMTGGSWSARYAFEAGLVTMLVEDGDLEESVDALVTQICQNSPSAIRLGLKALQELKEVAPQKQHQFLHQRLMEVIQTKDAQEGISAFREKRLPNWSGE
ncbi:enoyl-CoA hydratase-related protein [Aureispira sp. CCB-E]|uniref:enoyl-CoA hydratase/isomerase family protein n=1 Tax=Aureispira sp. CCB-E TaxID=3051121 RepID=UPI002868BACA|nr:enoyl-CoA hydratase-related protein [Aureispira sp. CCB-E]WMX12114.1 enoyl-CoA hydratase-related protein [Aureispira sp. CCB-E]